MPLSGPKSTREIKRLGDVLSPRLLVEEQPPRLRLYGPVHSFQSLELSARQQISYLLAYYAPDWSTIQS